MYNKQAKKSNIATTVTEAYNELVKSGVITQDKEQQLVVSKLDEFREVLESYNTTSNFLSKVFSKSRPSNKQGIYIYGDVGRGKSMLMDLFYEIAPIEKKKRVHFHAFMLDTHKRINKWRQEHVSGRDPIPPVASQIAAEATLICFDEFQVHDITDAMILSRLFKELFERNVMLVATSNTRPERLYEHGLQREQFMPFIDLIKSKTNIISLNANTDYRMKKLKAANDLYFTPLGKEAEEFLEKMFSDLTNNAVPQSETLDVNGRIITIDQIAGDVAMSCFKDLCEKPLGAADYIEISREFNTLLIGEIPQFNRGRRNEAKRFIHLIDELYEHNVKLICTAVVTVDKLAAEDLGLPEFERTISRLHEMQSDEYLKQEHLG